MSTTRTPTPTTTAGTPATPRPTNTPGGPAQTPVPTPVTARACPQITGRVPEAVIADALANPTSVMGWGRPANPGLPGGPSNPPRSWLSLQTLGKPYNPLFNGVVYKAGCP